MYDIFELQITMRERGKMRIKGDDIQRGNFVPIQKGIDTLISNNKYCKK